MGSRKNYEREIQMKNVKQPKHYTFGKIETIDYIKDKLSSRQFVGYCIGNVIKYVSRYRYKGGTEDLHKAQVYLGWAIEMMEEIENETSN